MQIFTLGNNMHEMSKPVFPGNNSHVLGKIRKNILSAENFIQHGISITMNLRRTCTFFPLLHM